MKMKPLASTSMMINDTFLYVYVYEDSLYYKVTYHWQNEYKCRCVETVTLYKKNGGWCIWNFYADSEKIFETRENLINISRQHIENAIG